MQSQMITPNKVDGAMSRGSNVGNHPYGYPHGGAALVDSCHRSSKAFSVATTIKPMPRPPKTDNPQGYKADANALTFDKEEGVSTRRQ